MQQCYSSVRWTEQYTRKNGSHHSCKSAETRKLRDLLYLLGQEVEQWKKKFDMSSCNSFKMSLGCCGNQRLLLEAWLSQCVWPQIMAASLLFMSKYSIVDPQLYFPVFNTSEPGWSIKVGQIRQGCCRKQPEATLLFDNRIKFSIGLLDSFWSPSVTVTASWCKQHTGNWLILLLGNWCLNCWIKLTLD